MCYSKTLKQAADTSYLHSIKKEHNLLPPPPRPPSSEFSALGHLGLQDIFHLVKKKEDFLLFSNVERLRLFWCEFCKSTTEQKQKQITSQMEVYKFTTEY